MSEVEKKEYTGGCHCKAYTYTALIQQPLTSVRECNCSICTINGYLGTMIPAEDFKGGDEGQLSTYMFNKKVLAHKFCKTCGTTVYATPTEGDWKGTIGLNVRSIHGIDVGALKKEPFDGKSKW